MKTAELIAHLPLQAEHRPVCLIGAAVIDVIADAYSLPYREVISNCTSRVSISVDVL